MKRQLVFAVLDVDVRTQLPEEVLQQQLFGVLSSQVQRRVAVGVLGVDVREGVVPQDGLHHLQLLLLLRVVSLSASNVE